jgi:glutamate N-acetyltransferase/amino-acid N-acetyltransferase
VRAAVEVEERPRGVTAVPGVQAAGVAAGLSGGGRRDLALVATGESGPAAAVQTANQVTAAPVQLTRRHLADGQARAVVLNSGSANACTGPEGLEVAEASAKWVAESLAEADGSTGRDALSARDVLVCSTGVIGEPPPRNAMAEGIPRAVDALSATGSTDAAEAILTTDTTTKEAAVQAGEGGDSCLVGGIAKGAGMLAPQMATMLGVLTTDAVVSAATLQACLRDAVKTTFGRISVDGCLSTNDAVVALATGSGGRITPPPALIAGLRAVCQRLATELVRDAEGARKLVRLRVCGARTEEEAATVGRTVADSPLVRTAFAGEDPNWGRIVSAAGAGPVPLVPDRLAISFGDVTVCRDTQSTGVDRGKAAAALMGKEIDVTLDLGIGAGEATVLTCDLTREYVTINADYTT